MGAAPEAEVGFGPEVLGRMQEKSKVLAKGRKGRQFPGLTAKEAVAKLTCVSSHPIHQSSAPGVNCVAVHKEKAERVATGGQDCNVVLFNAQTKAAVQKLPTRNVVVSASQDSTARVWVSSAEGAW